MKDMPHDSTRASKIRNLLQGGESVCLLNPVKATLTSPSVKLELVESGADLTQADLDACIHMIETTSGKDYQASSIGWHRSAKIQEMQDAEMVYLLLREDNDDDDDDDDATAETQAEDRRQRIHKGEPAQAGKPHAQESGILGFLSFMFTQDDPPHEEREVVYIYEIHLDERLRGRGLGSRLIGFAEHAARHCRVSKTMLTVFTANVGARALYERLGYSKDACSPRDMVMRRKVVKASYVIMSKELAIQL